MALATALASASIGGAPFGPQGIGLGLQSWWRADNGISAADIIAGTVGSWAPIFGTFGAAVQAVGANKPSYVPSWSGSKPAVQTSLTQWLSTVQVLGFGNIGTIVWAGQILNGTTFHVVADLHFGVGLNYQLLGQATNVFTMSDSSAAPASVTSTTPQSACTSAAVGALTAQPNNAIYLNGTKVAGNATTGAGIAIDGITIGNNNSHIHGGVTTGELIVYNRQLSAAEIATLYAYQKAFWGTP